jgi:hypothetical protein
VEVLMKGCDSVHNGLCFVYFIKVDEASRTNAREKVILPIEVRNKLRETQVITTHEMVMIVAEGLQNQANNLLYEKSLNFSFCLKSFVKAKACNSKHNWHHINN